MDRLQNIGPNKKTTTSFISVIYKCDYGTICVNFRNHTVNNMYYSLIETNSYIGRADMHEIHDSICV